MIVFDCTANVLFHFSEVIWTAKTIIKELSNVFSEIIWQYVTTKSSLLHWCDKQLLFTSGSILHFKHACKWLCQGHFMATNLRLVCPMQELSNLHCILINLILPLNDINYLCSQDNTFQGTAWVSNPDILSWQNVVHILEHEGQKCASIFLRNAMYKLAVH